VSDPREVGPAHTIQIGLGQRIQSHRHVREASGFGASPAAERALRARRHRAWAGEVGRVAVLGDPMSCRNRPRVGR
jgi:hypothetical protein